MAEILRGIVWGGVVALPFLAGLAPSRALAADVDISGVLVAANEMPHVAVILRRPDPLLPFSQVTPINVDDPIFGNQYAFDAYLDTGTSGILLSREYAQVLGIQRQQNAAGDPVRFYDVAVEGETEFHVSERLHLSIGAFPLITEEPPITNLAAINEYYSTTIGPVRTQLGLNEAGFLEEPRNIVGMPAMIDKVVVIDATTYNHNTPDAGYAIRTTVVNPGDASIPRSDRTVRLSYADFTGFTRLESPAGVTGEAPALTHNPMIGPDPLAAPGSDPNAPRGVSISRGTSTGRTLETSGSWLLDTGAQLSFMSEEQAAEIGIGYLTDATGERVLDQQGQPTLIDLSTKQKAPGQFVAQVGGGGGGNTSIAGFALETLRLPAEGGDIVYHDVPILVISIEVEDPDTGDVFTLDGDIGMNLFLPTMSLALEEAASAFDYVTFDEGAGELRLTFTTAVPEPAAAAVMGLAALGLLGRRRRRRRRHVGAGAQRA